MPENKAIKSSFLPVLIFLMIVSPMFYSCDKVTVEISNPPLPVHQKDVKPLTPVPLGCIRGYFGDYYKTFTQHIENVQSVDSFSNCYFYGSCNDALKQINLIRYDSSFVFAMYIMGYSLDSLPSTFPVPAGNGKFVDINFYPFQSWNWDSPGYYFLAGNYGYNVSITDKTDDILTGTFDGTLISSKGEILPVSEGEFKIKIFRKYMPCVQTRSLKIR
jgi:hypothetical protein